EEPPDVAGTPQEREETRARHPLRDVAAPVDEIAPNRADGPIARPHEQRPAPVPPPAEVLPGVTTRRGPPEDEEVTRASERVERSELARPNGLRAAHRPYPPSGCEVDLDDLCARLRQGARNATSGPTEGQREKGKEEARRRPAPCAASIPAVARVGLARQVLEEALLGLTEGERSQHLLGLLCEGNRGDEARQLGGRQLLDRRLHLGQGLLGQRADLRALRDVQRRIEAALELLLRLGSLLRRAGDVQLPRRRIEEPVERAEQRLSTRHS